ncbi:hypothetical protein SAMN04488096_10678 [Mesonia phycicola]|uniref:Uncharacterized protein n=1 Tax=Mesonia phycicola TaxID=579105 RepID=A0A1M6FCZ0_9FLAO|nr:DUF6029 family protein [Mesonia phycicola]SHI95598.1 hypothetical protein SAMN04488096_10678 [Mesonia phycicola]
MRKILLFVIVLVATFTSNAQDSIQKKEKIKGRFFGGVESNSQYYIDDSKLGDFNYDNHFRSNSYINANYNYGKFTAGVQVEAYEPNALLNYNPKFEGTNLATYYLNYKSDKIDATAGYFYEQFGSGLLLRFWEDRALGINNALRGGKIIYRPTNEITLKAIYGQQRTGFDVANSDIFGFDSEFYLTDWLNFETSDLSVGASYVGRYEKIDEADLENPDFNELTNAFGVRVNYSQNSFYLNGEANFKSKDAALSLQNTISNELVKSGSAYLLNFGYTKSGLGVDVMLRRLENMTFLSEREPERIDANNTSLNYNDKILNYVPGLTKQHHSNLANIYVYQAQYQVSYLGEDKMKSGETGGQIDVYYRFKKGTSLGGKYGTRVAVNLASWYNLPGKYRYFPREYDTEFFGVGQRYFSDYNIEIKKRIKKNWRTGFYYIHQYYDKSLIEGGDVVNADILSLESTWSFQNSKSIRVEMEHMWADADRGNWAGGTVEYNFNNSLSMYVWDIYNYGAHYETDKNHYYNIGGAYRFGASRLAVNFGRQRGGLVCVGGVCRYVPQNTGFTLNFSTSF